MTFVEDQPLVAYHAESGAETVTEAYTMGELDDYRIQSASSLRPDDIHEQIREQREFKRFAELVHGWFRRSAAKSVCTWRVSEESSDASAATLDLIRALTYGDDSAEGEIVAVKYEHKILFSQTVNITKLPRLQPRIANYEEPADENDE